MITPSFWHHSDSKIAKALSPLGALYGAISACLARRNTPEKLSVPVICIGNLVVGGAGKTPAAMLLGQALIAQGKRVHFVSRGYRGSLRGPVLVKGHSFQEVGDEPLMLAKIAPTWVAKDRSVGALAAVQAGAEIIILDDGHQNFTIHKDCSLVVIDTDYQFGNGRLFPAGPLRESPAQGLARAQGLILVGEKEFPLVSSLPFVRLRFKPCKEDLETFQSKTLLPFAGIGRPQKFFKMLEDYALAYDLKVLKGINFPDHYTYSEKDLENLQQKAKREGAMLVTTEKDWMRLSHKKGIFMVRLSPDIIEGSWDHIWKGLEF
jgi:tetraacyldisaccharide 4'-kinase